MNRLQCRHCGHLVQRPEELEATLPGLQILSSAYGSVRGETGWCRRHDRFVDAAGGCADLQLRQAPGAGATSPTPDLPARGQARS